MYAQAVRVQLAPGKADDAIAVFKDSVLPALGQRPNLEAAYLLIDREGNKGIGLTFWKGKEDVDALVSSGFFQEQVGKFEGLFSAPPEREVYEVALRS